MTPEDFALLHTGLPREGPGSDATTLAALGRIHCLPREPRVLDIGCGPGKQTLVLARALGVRVTAVDIHQPYLDRLRAAAAGASLSGLIETRRISMDALDYPDDTIDLIWCEGAIFVLGVSQALQRWRPMLRKGGIVAFTEASWLGEQRPAEAAAFWQKVYPSIGSVAENVAAANREGYEVFDQFTIPADDWWAEYYKPMQVRIAQLSEQAHLDADLAGVLDFAREEIGLFSRYHGSYGYVFYFARKI